MGGATVAATQRGNVLARVLGGLVAAVLLASAALVVVAAPASAAPPAPYNLYVDAPSPNRAALHWVGPNLPAGTPAIVSYLVWRDGALVTTVPATSRFMYWQEPAARPIGVDWYQVQAVYADGAQSAKTQPYQVFLAAGDTTRPWAPVIDAVTPFFGGVNIFLSNVHDDVGVAYVDVFDRGLPAGGASPDLSAFGLALPAGDHWLQVQAVDFAGNRSVKSAPVFVRTYTRPTAPTGLTAAWNAATGRVDLAWGPSTTADPAGVEYHVLDGGREIATTRATSISVDAAAGDHWYQVYAVAAPNPSARTGDVPLTVPPH